jgi:hypothetical protein
MNSLEIKTAAVGKIFRGDSINKTRGNFKTNTRLMLPRAASADGATQNYDEKLSGGKNFFFVCLSQDGQKSTIKFRFCSPPTLGRVFIKQSESTSAV